MKRRREDETSTQAGKLRRGEDKLDTNNDKTSRITTEVEKAEFKADFLNGRPLSLLTILTPKLKKLSIEGKLSAGVKNILTDNKELAKAPNLETLSLKRCGLEDLDVLQFANILKKHTKLKTLELSGNPVSPPTYYALHTVFGERLHMEGFLAPIREENSEELREAEAPKAAAPIAGTMGERTRSYAVKEKAKFFQDTIREKRAEVAQNVGTRGKY
jgi:hypothetical protein